MFVYGVPIQISGPEKTVADCFKFRCKVEFDVAIEALRFNILKIARLYGGLNLRTYISHRTAYDWSSD
jgi:hypothetical protein